jgi:hypothetical protein
VFCVRYRFSTKIVAKNLSSTLPQAAPEPTSRQQDIVHLDGDADTVSQRIADAEAQAADRGNLTHAPEFVLPDVLRNTFNATDVSLLKLRKILFF